MKIHLRTQAEVSSTGRGIIQRYSYTARGTVGKCLEWESEPKKESRASMHKRQE